MYHPLKELGVRLVFLEQLMQDAPLPFIANEPYHVEVRVGFFAKQFYCIQQRHFSKVKEPRYENVSSAKFQLRFAGSKVQKWTKHDRIAELFERWGVGQPRGVCCQPPWS
jgi:hypothetical protein